MAGGMDDPVLHNIGFARAVPIQSDAQHPIQTARIAGLAIDIMRGHDHHARLPRPCDRRRKGRGVRRVDGPKAEVDHIDPRLHRQVDRAHQRPRAGP
tara:strand:+ start:5885 stop:6175 length:291 start_codon:yes stop_codon:yes gene_type:complete